MKHLLNQTNKTMKSKEEIEQLAKEVHYESQNQGLNADGCFNQYQGYIKGYIQCQKDMADKKYTEEQMKVCFYHNCIDNPKAMFQDYLKEYILNKQD